MAVYMTGDIHGNPSRFYDLKSFCKLRMKSLQNCSVFMAITSGVLQKQMDINRSMSQRVRFRVR